jgi:hypothetical protein
MIVEMKRPVQRAPHQNVPDGQNAKYSSRVDVFRFASNLRRSSMRSALRICANIGSALSIEGIISLPGSFAETSRASEFTLHGCPETIP